MTTLEQIPTDNLFIPGLRFWGQARAGRFSIICQNENGAIEVQTAAGMEFPPPLGEIVSHSPTSRELHDHVEGCSVLGGGCYSRRSFTAYRDEFEPLLRAGDPRAVLKLLARWHDDLFAAALPAGAP